MDIDNWFSMPGGDTFEDVTDLFDQAASDMSQGEVVLSEGFTLMEAMGAFEIGEPRMDSGMILNISPRAAFEPLAPLLPDEVCWLLDRSFACEMEWHTGSTLSQTVYTLLYVHHLANMDPDFLFQVPFNDGSGRPLGLVTIVLRAAVMAMLKCCDLSWRELSKGRVHDMEDWQGEKCDVSLLEGVPAEYIIQKLDAACTWLHSLDIPTEQRDALITRLLLRKSLLELFRLDLQHARDRLGFLLVIAQNEFNKVQQYAPPHPAPESPAIRAVDPYITRRLPNFLPIRIVSLPPQNEVWPRLEQLLEGWSEVDSLLQSSSLSAWELTGSIRNWLPSRSLQQPYTRSLIQTCFFDRNLIAYQFPGTWISERFWMESLGFSWEQVSNILSAGLVDPQSTIHEVEKSVGRIVLQDIRSSWFNPPRRRRYLMKSLMDYLILINLLQQLTRQTPFEDTEHQAVANAIPYVLLLRQLQTALDIIFSGFQQDLYAHDERPVAYWQIVQIVEIYLDIVEEVKLVIPPDSPAYAGIEFTQTYHDALQKISGALCSLTIGGIRQSKDRISGNYKKRYKWLYTKSFPSNEEVAIIPIAGVDQFFSDSEQTIFDPYFAIEELTNAKNMLLQLTRLDVEGFWAPRQIKDQIEFIQSTLGSCEALVFALQSSVNNASAENHADDLYQKQLESKLRWVPAVHPWLPGLALDTI